MTVRAGHIFTLKISLLFVLLLSLIVQTGRLLSHTHLGKVDVTGRYVTSLSPETRDFLSTFDSKIAFTYFVTPKAQMPPHLKGVVSPVETLLETFHNTFPNRVSYRIIDPDLSGQEGHIYAARKKVSPFSVRSIQNDEHSDKDVWSSLVIAPEGHSEILIQSITPEDIPFLENLILTHLKALNDPPKPVIATSSPNYINLFTDLAQQFGQVVSVDLTNPANFPDNADVLIWLEPQNITQAHIKALQQFLHSGKTAIVAGSTYVIDYGVHDQNKITYKAFPTGANWQALLAPFGISPQPDLLMDENLGPVYFRGPNNAIKQAEAPFHLRVMPGFYNLKGFLSPARGALNFVAASALDADPRKVLQAGYQLDILGTTTEKAYINAIPQDEFGNADIHSDLKIGKQNVMLRLAPTDSWQGEMLVLATTSPFRDGIFNQPNYGHRVFLQTVLRTFTERTRIVKGRVERPHPPQLPKLTSVARVLWRFLMVFALPLGLILVATHRYVKNGATKRALSNVRGLPLRACLGLVGLLIASTIWTWDLGIRLDLTENQIHTPRPFTLGKMANTQIKADLIIPQRASLPTPLKSVEETALRLLNALDISVTIRRPEALGTQDRARLNAMGLKPFEVQTVQDDQEVSQWVWSGLLIHKPGGATVVPQLDDRTIDHLEFHILAAEQRLETGATPHVAVISEPPRLSPAEAFEYHQKQLTPPKGADVFSETQALLRKYGYIVTYVNPREPQIPAQTDLILWLQPRRDATQTTQIFSQFLAKGGKGLVALQHFNMQQRQYRGSGFQTVYWPQPQYQDLDPYLIPLGLGQVKEVLMDQTRARLSLETQINRTAVREFEAQEVALPFLIRAVNPNFDPNTPITKQLGDQLFIWGNRFDTQQDSLQKYGLRVQPLISTSSQAWAYDWQGGWMPEAVFSPTDSLQVGSQPLAVLAEGTFPEIVFAQDDSGQVTRTLTQNPSLEKGAMILLGSSEMFKNPYLYAAGFQHDQLLLNAVSYLTMGPEYTQIQARRKTAKGFATQNAPTILFWRIVVVGAGTVGFLLYGLIRLLQHRRISGTKVYE